MSVQHNPRPDVWSGKATVRLLAGGEYQGDAVYDGQSVLMPAAQLHERNPDRMYPPRARQWPINAIKDIEWSGLRLAA